jgi:hypothetical protein
MSLNSGVAEVRTLVNIHISLVGIVLLVILFVLIAEELLFHWAKKHYIQELEILKALNTPLEIHRSKIRCTLYAIICVIADPKGYKQLTEDTST